MGMRYVISTGTCRLCSRTGVGTRSDSYSAPPDFVCSSCDPRTFQYVLDSDRLPPTEGVKEPDPGV